MTDKDKQIESLEAEIERLKKKCSSLEKNNRNWRRKNQRLRGKALMPAKTPPAPPKKETQTSKRKETGPVNYYISDLHLFCKSQTKGGVNYDDRPFENIEEMHRHILEHWNAKVTNADTVYILGDIALRRKNDDLVSLVARLNGKKVLIVGNHDDLADYRYRQLFHDTCHYKEVTDNFNGMSHKLVLCHYPILMWNVQHRGTILLYGHTHNSVEDTFFQECIRKMNESEELSLRRSGGKEIRAINVGVSKPYIDYEPRSLKEITENMGAQQCIHEPDDEGMTARD